MGKKLSRLQWDLKSYCGLYGPLILGHRPGLEMNKSKCKYTPALECNQNGRHRPNLEWNNKSTHGSSLVDI